VTVTGKLLIEMSLSTLAVDGTLAPIGFSTRQQYCNYIWRKITVSDLFVGHNYIPQDLEIPLLPEHGFNGAQASREADLYFVEQSAVLHRENPNAELHFRGTSRLEPVVQIPRGTADGPKRRAR